MEIEVRNIQLIMLEMLELFDSVCRENKINYSLHGGTLLGAVRHKGFIPWDDDLDVFMERSEFDRFVKAWNKKAPSEYFLQTKDTEAGYFRSFAKIRKEHTTFLQSFDDPDKIHTGIFIDIMPIDRIPRGIFNKIRFYHASFVYEILCREFVPKNTSRVNQIIIGTILKINKPENRVERRKKLLKIIRKYDDNRNLPLVMVETLKTLRTPLPANIFDEYIELEFEGKKFMATKYWDAFLKTWFGDYMKLPPEEKRVCAHHPILVDTEKSYQEIGD